MQTFNSLNSGIEEIKKKSNVFMYENPIDIDIDKMSFSEGPGKSEFVSWFNNASDGEAYFGYFNDADISGNNDIFGTNFLASISFLVIKADYTWAHFLCCSSNTGGTPPCSVFTLSYNVKENIFYLSNRIN